ncbi:hypothetical protein [Hymenobacter roseosalivarius]|nr:hypothetical protein [Hymenobacter roseosalivarius]
MTKVRKAATLRLSEEVLRAVHRKEYDVLEQLVNSSTVHLTDSMGRSLLSMVINHGDVPMLQWLLTQSPALD